MQFDVINPSLKAVESTINFPQSTIGGNASILAYASSNAEGLVSTSGDGTLLVVTGYSTTVGASSPASSSWSEVPRAVATCSCTGAVVSDTTLSNSQFSSGNIRSAATYDGSYFYVSTEQSGILFARKGPNPNAARMDSPQFTSPRAISVGYEAVQGRWQLYTTASGGAQRGLHALGSGLPFINDTTSVGPNLLPGFDAMASGTPQQYAWENNSSIWMAEAGGIGHWIRAAGSGRWSRAAAVVPVPPHPDDTTNTNPDVRALVGRLEAPSNAWTMYLVPTDALGTLKPRIMSYTPNGAVWTTIITSPSLGEVYKGVAFPPSCVPVAPATGNGGIVPPPTPMASASPSPSAAASAAPMPVTTIIVNTTSVLEGDKVSINVTSSAPSALDFLAVFTPSDANIATTAPMRVLDLGRFGDYATTGRATAVLRLVAMPGGLRVVLMRAPAGTDVSASPPYPAYDSWLGSGMAALPGSVAIGVAAPWQPSRVRALPGDRIGDYKIAFTTSAQLSRPVVQWGASASALTTTVAADVSNIRLESLCPDYPTAGLRSMARAEGWADLGYQYTAIIQDVGPASAPSAIFYRVGDAAASSDRAATAWSQPMQLATAPKLLPALDRGTSAPYSFLLSADTASSTEDDSVTFRTRGLATRPGVPRMRADIDAAAVGSRPPILGFIIAGDISYSDGLMATYADFSDMNTALSSRVPFWYATGNHEAAYGGYGGDYFSRPTNSYGECNVPISILYPQPHGASIATPWYWYASGAVTFVHLSTEHNFTTGSPQWRWLASVLPAINRAITPWVIILAHRPTLVASNQDPSRTDSHGYVAQILRTHVLPMATAAQVTAFIGGHQHSYQRHCVSSVNDPANPTCALTPTERMIDPLWTGSGASPGVSAAAVYENPPGPVHLSPGNGGVDFDGEDPTTPTLLLLRKIHGYVRLTVSPAGDRLDWEAVAYGDGSTIDRARITQDPTVIVNTAQARAAAAGIAIWTADEMDAGSVGRSIPLPAPSTSAHPGAAGGDQTSLGVGFFFGGTLVMKAIMFWSERKLRSKRNHTAVLTKVSEIIKDGAVISDGTRRASVLRMVATSTTPPPMSAARSILARHPLVTADPSGSLSPIALVVRDGEIRH